MLTPEQINQIRAQDKLPPIQPAGSVNNIDRSAILKSAWGEPQQAETGLKGFSTGFAKGELSTIKGLGSMGAKVGQTILKPFGIDVPNVYSEEYMTEHPEAGTSRLLNEQNLKAQTPSEKIGKVAEIGAEFALPGLKVGKEAKVIEKLAERKAVKSAVKNENFLTDLVSPKASAEVKEQALKQGRVTEAGLLKKSKILPSRRDKQLAEAVKDYVSPKNPITQNIDSVDYGVKQINEGVKEYVRTNKVPFNTNQLKHQLDKGKDELNVIFASDTNAEKTYNAVIKEFMKHVAKKDTEGLLQARQEFDKIPAIKKLLESQGLGENVKKQVVLTAREMANKYIAKLLPEGNKYRSQILQESKMIEALGNMAEKNSGMIGKNKLQMLTNEYPILKWIVGGAVGAAGVGVGGALIGSTD